MMKKRYRNFEKYTGGVKTVILAFVFLIYQVSGINAQDIITKKTGEDIRAKVTVINDVEVKYRQFNNLSGPVFAISTDEIFMIKYENGSKDIFEKHQTTGKIQIRHVEPKKPQNPVAVTTPVTPTSDTKPTVEPEKTVTPEVAQQTAVSQNQAANSSSKPSTTPTPEPKKATVQQDNSQKQATNPATPSTSDSKQKIVPVEPEDSQQTALAKLPEPESAIEQTVRTQAVNDIEKDIAVVKMDYPESVKSIPSPSYNVQSRIYKWTTSFRETGGKSGFKLQAIDFYIESPSGKKYTNNWSASVDVTKNGNESVNYWVNSNGQWDNGWFHAVWVGKDDLGNKIRMEQKVQLIRN